MAYAELVFTDLCWPEFRTEAFLKCLDQYQRRERRYGLTSTQVRRSQPSIAQVKLEREE
jgi:undecaprenyl diphosphate synthase